MAGRDPIEDLVERVVERVQQRMQVEAVPPSPVLHGTWQDQSFAHLGQAGADRVGTSGAVPRTQDASPGPSITRCSSRRPRADIV